MSKPTIMSLTERLDKVTCEKDYIINEQLKRIRQLEGSPKIQDKLNMANATVAELMKEVKDLQTNSFNLYTENEKLKSDYALLEDNYNVLSKHHDDLIYKFNENLEQHKAIEAENYALKAEIERTNRHINLAENQLHREQSVEKQPLVVNHYHNCTINK